MTHGRRARQRHVVRYVALALSIAVITFIVIAALAPYTAR
jgi:hypothetical protein